LSSRLQSRNVEDKIHEAIIHRLRVFENRVMRRIFGPKGVEAKGEWRKLQNGNFII
jgi:hypothetical protein